MEHDTDEGETIIKVILNSRKGIFFYFVLQEEILIDYISISFHSFLRRDLYK